MPALHEPVPATDRTTNLDERVDRLRRPAGYVLSFILGGLPDQGGRPYLSVLQHAGQIS